MEFVAGGAEALDCLGREPFDMIVSDMQMPMMDGAELLNTVKERYPNMIRIILSGYADPASVVKLVLPAHQYLSKPYEPEVLTTTIAREFMFRELLMNETMRKVLSRIERLPSMPPLYKQIIKDLESPESSVVNVANIISRDPGMSTKVLQLVNSAFFVLPSQVSSPLHAVRLLGLDMIKTLVLSIHIFSEFDEKTLKGPIVTDIWKHSLRVGLFAKAIAKAEGQGQTVVDDCFMAGLLHDVGKLILAQNFPEEYGEAGRLAEEDGIPFEEAEQRVFDHVSHAHVGAYLLGLWGLPLPFVETILFHHASFDWQTLNLLAFVQFANAAEHEEQSRRDGRDPGECTSFPSFRSGERVEAWLDACSGITEETPLYG